MAINLIDEIAIYLKKEANTLDEKTKLEKLRIDSLDIIDMLAYFEKQRGFIIKEYRKKDFKTIGDLISILEIK